jgi:arylamine N-acetyltransferase
MSENAVDRFGRTTYTRAQLEQYFQHISLPAETAATLLDPASRPTLESLATLIKYQLCAVPFESLALHYNPNHDVNINPQYLFQKIVGNGRGRGGYCMENNTFFGTVLRSLRFDVLSTGARINGEVANEKLAANEEEERGTYMGWLVKF